jgi:hypothetical protein
MSACNHIQMLLVSIFSDDGGELWESSRSQKHRTRHSATLPDTTTTIHTHHERRQHVLPIRLLSQPQSPTIIPQAPLTKPAGRLPNAPPAPQPSPLASLRRSAEVLPVHRSPLSNRQSRRFCACGAVHEGNPRDTSVRFLARRDPDSGSAGR